MANRRRHRGLYLVATDFNRVVSKLGLGFVDENAAMNKVNAAGAEAMHAGTQERAMVSHTTPGE